MGKVKITAGVVSQTCIATDIYSLILKAGEIVSQAVAVCFCIFKGWKPHASKTDQFMWN